MPESRRFAGGRPGRHLLGASVLLTLGCTTTYAIRTQQLPRLDGYDAHGPSPERTVETVEGAPVEYSGGAGLLLALPEGEVGGTFDRIRVQDGRFDGVTTDGQPVSLELDRVRAARVVKMNQGATIILIAGILLAAVGAGLYAATHSGGSNAVEGRPLRIGGRTVAANLARAHELGSGDWSDWAPSQAPPGLSAEAKAALAAFWAETARAEHASIAAFSRLSLTLMAMGAPARLVDGAHRAAGEEVRHARVAFTYASRYAGAPVGPAPLGALRGAPAVTTLSLRGLAEESLVEGWLMEGVAAAAVEETSDRATDLAMRRALATIAAEETSHAAMAWEIVEWCCERGGDAVRDHLRARLRRVAGPVVGWAAPQGLEGELLSHGWIPPRSWRGHFERVRREADARLGAPAPAAAAG